MKRLMGRIRRSILRFFLRHWAGLLILLLLLLAAFTGYQMWRVGPVMAVSLLPQLVICLILIAAVVAVRRVIKALTDKSLVESTVNRGQAALKDKVEETKDTLVALGADMKRDLGRLVGGPAAETAPVRCAVCGREARAGARFCEGCGAALYVVCGRCGQMALAGAKFCWACGAPLGAGAARQRR